MHIPYYVVVQFYPWFKFYFLLFWGMVMYDDESGTKEKKTQTKDKIEPQHIYTVITGHNHPRNFHQVGNFLRKAKQDSKYFAPCE